MNTRLTHLRSLIREYVSIIKENEGGGDYGGFGYSGFGYSGGGYYGVHFATNEQMYDIFVRPFVDVFKVAAAETKKISVRAQTALTVAFETIVTSLLPIFADSYDDIFKAEHDRIKKIKADYADVYREVFDSFKNMDVLLPAFMFAPHLFLTAQLVRHAPHKAAHVISILSGGRFDNVPVMRTFLHSVTPARRTQSRPGESFPLESVIREEKGDKKDNIDKLIKFLSNEKVQREMKTSSVVRDMSKMGKEITFDTLNDVIKHAQSVLGAKSIDDLLRVAKKNVPGVEKLKKLPDDQRVAAEAKLLSTVKESMKNFYVGPLEQRIKAYENAGVSSSHPFILAHKRAIEKIKGM